MTRNQDFSMTLAWISLRQSWLTYARVWVCVLCILMAAGGRQVVAAPGSAVKGRADAAQADGPKNRPAESDSETAASQPQAGQLSLEEQKEYARIQKRFQAHEGLLTGATWTLGHVADDSEVDKVQPTLKLFWAFFGDNTEQMPKLVEAGGIKGFKSGVVSMLESGDPVVRGFGAILLGVIGDVAYKNDVAKLLDDKNAGPANEEDEFIYNYDRSSAAMALGLMGATEYAARLSALLGSSDEADRAGAALGLGYMGAKQYVSKIADLLDDDDRQVQIAAIGALVELDAKEHAANIARLLTFFDEPQVAFYALVRLNAKEHANDIAMFLFDEFLQGDAAKALALLGAKEYTEEIAQLLASREPLARCDALIALGILNARERERFVAARLLDADASIRSSAATALVLMGSRTHTKEILAVLWPDWAYQEEPPVERVIMLSPLVKKRDIELRSRVNDALKAMTESQDRPRQPAQENRTVPPAKPQANGVEVITNSIGMKLVYLEPGEFVMGSPSNDMWHKPHERQHRVTLTEGFYLGVYEVTQAQWQTVMGTSIVAQREKEFLSSVAQAKRLQLGMSDEQVRIGVPLQGEGDAYPMYYVSWEDATEFCRKLSAQEDREYRLPTEAEWEYACRAGTTTAYSWGAKWQVGRCNAENVTGVEWDSNVSIFRRRGLPIDSTVPVGSFEPNPWGLYDMHGNVEEWCSDWYGDYAPGPVVDPVGAASSLYRVFRGGGNHSRYLCRSASRGADSPRVRNYARGLRVAISSKTTGK